MTLLNDILAYKPFRGECSVAALMRSLNKQDQQDLTEALANKAIMHTAIVNVLRARGVTVSKNSIGRHRQGECACR